MNLADNSIAGAGQYRMLINWSIKDANGTTYDFGDKTIDDFHEIVLKKPQLYNESLYTKSHGTKKKPMILLIFLLITIIQYL